MPTPSAIALLKNALDDDDPEVRIEAGRIHALHLAAEVLQPRNLAADAFRAPVGELSVELVAPRHDREHRVGDHPLLDEALDERVPLFAGFGQALDLAGGLGRLRGAVPGRRLGPVRAAGEEKGKQHQRIVLTISGPRRSACRAG